MGKMNIAITGKDNAVMDVKDLISYITSLSVRPNITVNIYVQSIGNISNSTVSEVNKIYKDNKK